MTKDRYGEMIEESLRFHEVFATFIQNNKCKYPLAMLRVLGMYVAFTLKKSGIDEETYMNGMKALWLDVNATD